MNIKTVGSVCSGIEAASVAWTPLGFEFEWFSEIEDFPSKVLKSKYPNIINIGDMNNISSNLSKATLNTPDLICAGTPCQAFSLAGSQNGLNDDRGNLTLSFVDIVNANDAERLKKGLSPTIALWENVEGVLSDKTNAFGCLVSSIAGFDEVIKNKKWPNSGVIHGPTRNLAWRVLDAKFFGVPQQRKRLYLIASGKDFFPENILFEKHNGKLYEFPLTELQFTKDGCIFEIFREYTDCLYSAYGTKWNGNAAAYNGSLFIVQNGRIRRLSPLECERLMGFPDNYTDVNNTKKTARFKAIGNSWAIPVIKWIGERILNYNGDILNLEKRIDTLSEITTLLSNESFYMNFGKNIISLDSLTSINCTNTPENCKFSSMYDIVSPSAPEDLYISPVGCSGILRRKNERNLKINTRLEEVLLSIANTMSPEDIEKRSRLQKRGRFSSSAENNEVVNNNLKAKNEQLTFLNLT